MKHIPLSISLENRRCLVVGGGKVAERKVLLLLRAGAIIHVVAPELTSKLMAIFQIDKITWREGEATSKDIYIDTPFLVVAATNNGQVNKDIAKYAEKSQIPINVADNAKLSSFFFPSIINHSPVTIAISTGGASPALARSLRKNLAPHISTNIGKLAEFSEGYRVQLRNKVFDISERQHFWRQVLDGEVAELVLEGKENKAKKAMQTLINNYSDQETQVGEVYLVGAGPGDPELLTLKALKIMQKATVILHDRLVSKDILELCNPDAELIYVGKRKADHSVPQELLNHMLVRLALEGHRVCRLKGGDPFIFGRGGEEIDKLAMAGVNFQVVPGITAASGCATYAGIPLTHRDHAQSVTFITGHSVDKELDWQLLCKKNQTLVIYMGLDKLEPITTALIEHGLDADTPAALIEQGTTTNQRVHVNTMGNLLNTVKQANVQAPTIIIIGSVVSLHNQLGWFKETKAHKSTSIFSSGSEGEANGKRIR